MCQITLEIPEDSLQALRLTQETAAGEMRMLAAMKLYELGRLSSGAAAHLADLSRVEFLQRLAEYGVPAFNHSLDDLENEARLV